jgi:hypothetical protein
MNIYNTSLEDSYLCASGFKDWDSESVESICSSLCLLKANHEKLVMTPEFRERYSRIFPLIFEKPTKPDGVMCIVYTRCRDAWLKSGRKDAGVFSLTRLQYGLGWKLYLLGFLTIDDTNQFGGLSRLDRVLLGTLRTDAIPEDYQFVIREEKLRRVLPIDLPAPVPEESECIDTGSYYEPFYIAREFSSFVSILGSKRLLNELVARGNVIELVEKRMMLYQALLQMTKLDKKAAFTTLKSYVTSLNMDHPGLQRFLLLLLCYFARAQPSFAELFIYCESCIASMVCFSCKHECKDEDTECQVMGHSHVIQKTIEGFKEQGEPAKVLDCLTIRMRKNIESNFGSLTNIYERFIASCRDSYVCIQ